MRISSGIHPLDDPLLEAFEAALRLVFVEKANVSINTPVLQYLLEHFGTISGVLSCLIKADITGFELLDSEFDAKL